MDFEFSPEHLDFLAEVEAFLDANDDPHVFDVTRETDGYCGSRTPSDTR